MSDYLVNLGANPRARKAVKMVGLPIPLPQKLRRADGPWAARPLLGAAALVGLADGSALADAIELLLKDPALRVEMAANGRRKADEFRWERVAKRVLDYYDIFIDR
ncbi:MAG: hypothetical protein QGH45_21255, partial [Myxococcota bacterium]|nr:hypothetical protein [Myxococcota bacterium]